MRMSAGRAEAAAVVWNRCGKIKATPTRLLGRARVRGSLQASVAGCFGLGLYVFWVPAIGTLALGLAALVLVSALASPTGVYAGLERLFRATARTVGHAMTWVVLLPLFYLFFAPFGVLLRRRRRDQLRRFFEPEASTYWEDHPTRTPSSRERLY